jgi:uncharacterized NAD-dependent epimerase/dehydratase family protein
VSSGLHIISGLHIFLKEDPKLVQLARESHVMLWDVRDCDQKNIVAQKKKRPTSTKVITIVGTDCSVGKMCTALELHQGAQKQGRKSAFVATGQTGILISGSGVPLDRVIGDFMAGHVERCLFEAIKQENPEWIFVEGQGSLLHPGYSSVTLSLIHGSDPDALILCHNPELSTLWGYEVPIPPLSKVIEFYEQAASWPNGLERKAKVVGIALNTSGFSEENAQQIIQAIGIETGLPVTDPVRYSVNPLLEALSRS